MPGPPPALFLCPSMASSLAGACGLEQGVPHPRAPGVTKATEVGFRPHWPGGLQQGSHSRRAGVSQHGQGTLSTGSWPTTVGQMAGPSQGPAS